MTDETSSKLCLGLRDLYCRLESIKNLIYNGKIVEAHDKIKGASAKCVELYKIVEEKPDATELVDPPVKT